MLQADLARVWGEWHLVEGGVRLQPRTYDLKNVNDRLHAHVIRRKQDVADVATSYAIVHKVMVDNTFHNKVMVVHKVMVDTTLALILSSIYATKASEFLASA